jgi:hypothetical protein
VNRKLFVHPEGLFANFSRIRSINLGVKSLLLEATIFPFQQSFQIGGSWRFSSQTVQQRERRQRKCKSTALLR